MVNEKGLDPAAADRIGEFVQQSGGSELADKLTLGKFSLSHGLAEAFAQTFRHVIEEKTMKLTTDVPQVTSARRARAAWRASRA